jgi:hypothetical protein
VGATNHVWLFELKLNKIGLGVARHQWLIPVILTTWEVDIGRIKFQT